MSSSQSHSTKQKQRKVKEGDDPFLPQEIITNILKRLPVKSLIRFKCVCKLWKNLIKTPSFIHEHLHHASIQNPCLLFGDLSPHWSLQLYLLDNDMKVREGHCDSLYDIQRYCGIIGSSNGLLCVTSKISFHPILLWNPAIRQVRGVPKPVNCYAGHFFNSGFGFSSIVNDYKILIIDYLPNVRDYQVEVYSLRTGSWKKVESSLLKDVFVLPGSFAANGSIFWFGVKENVDSMLHLLVSYDMAVEVFTLIPSPISSLKAVDVCLTVHENKLAIVSHTSIRSPVCSLIDLWVMEDGTGRSGERRAWTKKFSISHPFLSVSGTIWRNKMVCHPRCFGTTEGEMLDAETKGIALVNLTTSEVNMFVICKYGRPYPILNYVESLVPVSKDHIEEL